MTNGTIKIKANDKIDLLKLKVYVQLTKLELNH